MNQPLDPRKKAWTAMHKLKTVSWKEMQMVLLLQKSTHAKCVHGLRESKIPSCTSSQCNQPSGSISQRYEHELGPLSNPSCPDSTSNSKQAGRIFNRTPPTEKARGASQDMLLGGTFVLLQAETGGLQSNLFTYRASLGSHGARSERRRSRGTTSLRT